MLMNTSGMKKKVWLATGIAILLTVAICMASLAIATCDKNNDTTPTRISFEEGAPLIIDQSGELRAVWIGYMSEGYITAEKIDTMVERCKSIGANAIIFHVRPFSDALYKSSIFPWSHVAAGEQGKAPKDGFDPLAYIIERSHAEGLQLHAWVNPLRIQLGGGRTPDTLADSNPYVKWRSDDDPANDRWVIDYNKGKYYDPSVPQVRELITAGMVELAENYNVDGLHWDDYFYPAEDASFDDSAAYEQYTNGGGTLSLLDWRTDNINRLVSGVYSAVHAVREDCVFGISPAGNIGNCLRAGADVHKWCAEKGFIDYICPQIYWPFSSDVAPFAERCREWKAMVKEPSVRFYVGLALYKVGTDADKGKWQGSTDEIARQIEFLRTDEIAANGYMIFSYENLFTDLTNEETENIRRCNEG